MGLSLIAHGGSGLRLNEDPDCRPFYGGGYVVVVVDLLFYVPPIVCRGSVLVLFGIHNVMSFLVLQFS